VTLAARPEVGAALHGVPEAMFAALPGSGPLAAADLPPLREALKGKSALAIGPGIHRGPETGPLIGELVAGAEVTVPDADALNALAEHRDRIAARFRKAPTRPLLTPHPGEFARLTGEESERPLSDRLGSAGRGSSGAGDDDRPGAAPQDSRGDARPGEEARCNPATGRLRGAHRRARRGKDAVRQGRRRGRRSRGCELSELRAREPLSRP